ncbi:hypothetical protein C9439_03710 [archaeon SCG-AAA382B04]|nr:hypothetical protein C9439_03710 [archaeon SCG-AAA382B04]
MIKDLRNKIKQGDCRKIMKNLPDKTIDLVLTNPPYGTNKKDLVLDPFLGSGTTAIACKKLSRDYLGMEINKEYIKIAKKRLNKIRGEKVTLKEYNK